MLNNFDVKINFKEQTLFAFLSGEIDHHSASKIRVELDVKINTLNPSLLILDFTNISFMDSSGIGLILGRYKLMKLIGGNLKIVNPSPQISKVMSLAGFDRLAVIEKVKPCERGGYVG